MEDKKYKPSRFMAETSHYDKTKADKAVAFINCLSRTKGTWAGKHLNFCLGKKRLSETFLA